ncbi:hypothetical protein DEU31_3033 [Brachybacterium sp. AG952]|uniref:hypothetical protein n=1 Tax=Brachybacterium sp. AG952 TaxID=2183989 RepID=UPI00105C70A0|nr:hypothetical protein [Brachybacterium sp. AG952]TDP76326.1 hypothetical protein DEU31_3033 [Brachybacterium sp. AG952]
MSARRGSDPTVDRVAAALAAYQRPTREWDEIRPSLQSYYRGLARAALASLAELGHTEQDREKEKSR